MENGRLQTGKNLVGSEEALLESSSFGCELIPVAVPASAAFDGRARLAVVGHPFEAFNFIQESEHLTRPPAPREGIFGKCMALQPN